MKKEWMIRRDSKISGPFSFNEVEALILSGKLSEVDEVTQPCKRWYFFRDRVEFTEAFNKLNFDGAENSLTAANESGLKSSDRTQEVTVAEDLMRTNPVFDLKENEKKGAVNYKKTKVTGVRKDNTKKYILASLFLGVLTFVGYYLWSSSAVTTIFKTELKNNFALNWTTGAYKQALQNIQGHPGLKSSKKFEYASLLLMEDGKSKEAQEILKKTETNIDPKWMNLRGLRYLYNGDLTKAESELIKSAQKDKSFIEPVINLGFLYRERHDWEFAKSYFESAFSRKSVGEFDEVGFYLAESWARGVVQSGKVEDLKPVIKFIENQLLSKTAFLYEFSFLRLWVNFYSNSMDSEEILKGISLLDPDLLFSRKRPAQTFRPQEGSFDYICNSLKTTYDEFIYAICKVMDGNTFKVSKDSQELVKTLGSSNGLALASFINHEIGEETLANDYLAQSFKDTKEKGVLKFFEQARFCQRNANFKCAAENWMKALSLSKEAFTALTGLATAYHRTGDEKRTKQFFERAGDFTAQYVPFKKLELELKSL